MKPAFPPSFPPGAASGLARALLLAAALLASAPFAAPFALGLSGTKERIASAFVCFASGAPMPDAQKGRPGPASDRGIDCVLCQTLCRGVAPMAARPGLVGATPILGDSLRSRMVADRVAPTPRPLLSNRARAPPSSLT
ncbi:hypothetical protein [Methylocystis parvus]|uniref:DUF2946 domain-containing protein n=1 Tax=Methylocystis parvus TaxID=134 RepID=A0A6B8MCD3_9HYPH|nr:hypothetical protein [Methylocystis parvus]QGM99442.1 hypothetical protein F7D14_19430 [Methylocystis parvus]WBK00166.1 hypothetical protein MMG94_00095 [Methylocystis parvus OBBP]